MSNEGLSRFLRLLLHKSSAGVPGLTDLFAGGIIAVLELVKHQGMELLRIDFSLFIENSLFSFDVDDFADNAGNELRIDKLEQLTFHDHREFLDDGRMDLVALHCVITGSLKFVIDLVARSNAEEISDVHMGFIGKRNSKRLAGLDIQPGFLAFTDKQDDFIVVTNLTQATFMTLTFSFSSYAATISTGIGYTA